LGVPFFSRKELTALLIVQAHIGIVLVKESGKLLPLRVESTIITPPLSAANCATLRLTLDKLNFHWPT
jgi:hypothetical protein